MKSATAERVLITEGVLDSAEYTIDPEEFAHIMGILRSSLYTRKALAVMREYSSNGWDAHQMFGLPDVPLKIQLPTFMNPTFKCRDFGPGLSRPEVLFTYTKYGKSTKRRTNKAVGSLGIGSKAAFCIGDRFNITSWHQGTKSIYTAALDKSNKGWMQLIEEEDCGDETGIEIQVAVDSKWIFDFEREAHFLFRYMRPQPVINTSLRDLPAGLESGFIRQDDHAKWIGVMGCVPYRIDIAQLEGALKKEGLWDNFQKLGGGIYIPIGDVPFAANREELQYDDGTIDIIVRRFKSLIEEYVSDALSSFNDDKVPGWDRHCKAHFLNHDLGFPLPARFQKWSHSKVPVWARENTTPPTTFRMYDNDKHLTQLVPVSPDTCLLFQDAGDTRKLDGWEIHKFDVIVSPENGATEADVKAELAPLLAAVHLDGIPMGSLTAERMWYAPQGRHSNKHRVPNAKHKQRTFKMIGTNDFGTLSNNWEKVEPPTEAHPYFILNGFRSNESAAFYVRVRNDKMLAAAFGKDFPTVYGYKTTSAKPVTSADIDKGILYATWRIQFFADLMTPEIRTEIREMAWAGLFNALPYKYDGYGSTYGIENRMNFRAHLPKIIESLTASLGEKHLVTRFFARHLEGKKAVAKIRKVRKCNLTTLSTMFPGRNKRSAPRCALDRILKTYPMLSVSVETDNDLYVFLTHLDILIRYILDIDEGSELNPRE